MAERDQWMIYGANGYIGRSELRNAINRLFFRII